MENRKDDKSDAAQSSGPGQTRVPSETDRPSGATNVPIATQAHEPIEVRVGQVWQRSHKKHLHVQYEVVFDWGDGDFNLKCISDHVENAYYNRDYRKHDVLTVKADNMERRGWKLIKDTDQ